jgi:DegV family protein with EDD domain
MRIGIVTDSTADQPVEFYDSYKDMVMVPLTVHFGTEVYQDWREMPPDLFYKKMIESVDAGILPKTSQPPAGDFVAAYKKLAADGVDHIISIHISSKISGTIQSAKAATGMFTDVPVTLVDSEQTSGLLGIIVKVLAELRDAGASLEDLQALTNYGKEWGKFFFTVKTLKYLELGGRIGKAQAMLGTLLSVKPILTLTEGMVAPAGKASGTKKVIKEIAALAKSHVDSRPQSDKVRLLLAYTDNPEIIDSLKAAVDEAGLKYDELQISQVGAVIGTYVGPGAFMIGVL